MQHEVLFFSPHFIDDTLNTRAECVRDSLICRKYMFLAKIFALRSMGIQLVPSPLIGLTNGFIALKGTHILFLFAFTAAGVVQCGGRKTSPHT